MSSAAVPPAGHPARPPAPRPAVAPPSAWRTSPPRLSRLLLGLVVFGVGDALIIRAELGNTPWTVFAQGVSLRTPLSIGLATIVVGVVLLLAWVPLRVRPGLGTLLNVVLIGLAIDATLLVLGPVDALPARAALLAGGIGLIGIGSGLYLGTRHGPGPRDGLMTGLHARTGWSVRRVRAAIEVAALLGGIALGGIAGIGTVAFALLIGPSVQAGIALDTRLWRELLPA